MTILLVSGCPAVCSSVLGLGFGVLGLGFWGWGLGFGGVVGGLVGCTYTHLLKIYSLNSL